MEQSASESPAVAGQRGNGGEDEAVVRTVADIGRTIREARERAGLTLRAVADATGLSTSLLSLVERGLTAPSIGTLVSVCDVLEVPMSSLFTQRDEAHAVLISASETARLSVEGLTRRLILDDRQSGLEVTEHIYEPGAASAAVATHHSGEEVGVVIEGRLDVEVNGKTHQLAAGDAVHFPSTSPHRFQNRGRRRTRALWVNLHRK